MARPLVGRFDPAITEAMNRVMALYRGVFRTENEATFLVDGTARAGIEAVLVSLLEPGDRVVVPIIGRFGHLLTEIASRCGAEVHTVEGSGGRCCRSSTSSRPCRPCGRPSSPPQGDTSTPCANPWRGWAPACAEVGALLYADVTASSAATPSERWTGGTSTRPAQGCRSACGGAVGQRAGVAVGWCRGPGAGSGLGRGRAAAADDHDGGRPVIRSNYFDVCMLLDYLGTRRLTTPPRRPRCSTPPSSARSCCWKGSTRPSSATGWPGGRWPPHRRRRPGPVRRPGPPHEQRGRRRDPRRRRR